VTKEGDEDQLTRIFESAGGSVEAIGITEDGEASAA
jgi:hypothetical protein